MTKLGLAVVTGLILTPLFLIAGPLDPLPDSALWAGILDFLRNLGSVKGAIAAFVALATVFFRVSIGANLAGKWTLAVLYGLSGLAFAVEGWVAGTPFMQIVTDSVVTSALLNSANEVIKHLFEPKAKKDLLVGK